jgi:hypothetical protein
MIGKSMHDVCTYTIQLSGQVSEAEINALGPLQMMLERACPEATWFTIQTDQSGLIGLMRHLHGLGFVFVSMNRTDPNP